MAKLNELDFAWDGKTPAIGERVGESTLEHSLDESEDDEA